MEEQTLYTVKQFCEIEKQHSVASIRWLMRQGGEGGFKKCTVRVGGRVFISRPAYIEWVNSLRGHK